MNPLAWLSRKLSAMVHPADAGRTWWSVLAGTDGDFDYEAEAGELWKNSAVAACLRVKCENFAQPRLEVHRKSGRGKGKAIEKHPAALLCENPNPYYDRYVMWAAFVLSADVDGNAYMIKIRSAARIPVQLWWVPPGLIEPKGRGAAFIDHYLYSVGGRQYRIDPADVIHYRHFTLDPENPRKGLAPLKSGLRAICGINEADGYTASLLRNMGAPPYAIVPAGEKASLNREQAAQAKATWRENLTGSKRGEPFVSYGPIALVKLGLSPEEMALDKLPARLEDQVASLTGVDPMVAGLTSGAQHKTYANKAEARKGLYEETLIPFQARVGCCLDLQLLGDVGMGDRESQTFVWNYDGIACIADQQDALYERVGKAYKEHQVIKRSEAREKLGYAVDPIEDDVYFTAPASPLVPSAGDQADDDTDPDPDTDPQEGEKRHPFGPGGPEIKREPFPAPENTFALPTGATLAKRLKGWFRKQRLDVLAEWLPPTLTELPDSFATLADYDDPMASAMTPTLAAYWQESGEQVYGRLGLDPDAWRVVDPHVAAKIDGAALDFCRATNETTTLELGEALERLKRELIEGIVEEGDSLPELRKRVQRVFTSAEDYRAERIAATEASRAVHAAEIESAKASGVVAAKKLLMSGDACEVCQAIKASEPKDGWPLDAEMARTSNHPVYGSVAYPPLHVSCQCSLTEVLIPDHDPNATGEGEDEAVSTPVPRAPKQRAVPKWIEKAVSEGKVRQEKVDGWEARYRELSGPEATARQIAWYATQIGREATEPEAALVAWRLRLNRGTRQPSRDTARVIEVALRKTLESRPLPEDLRERIRVRAADFSEAVDLARVWVRQNLSPEPTDQRRHGMASAEPMRSVEWEGVRWYAPEELVETMASTITQLAMGEQLPESLIRHTNHVYFTGQKNSEDDFWKIRYNNPAHISAATGGDGSIVVYNSKALYRGGVIHEMGHNLATGRYGSTNPPAISDFALAASSPELRVSDYAENALSEDFAESVRYYFETRDKMGRDHPKRFEVIRRLIEDETYGG